MQTGLNSFESDMFRGVVSWRFLVGVAAEFLLLVMGGMESEVYPISIPLICTLPYTTAILEDMQCGYIKSYLLRTDRNAYIYGKAFSCMLCGGMIEVIPVLCYAGWKQSGIQTMLYLMRGGLRLELMNASNDSKVTAYYGLLFMSGALWSMLSATLSTWAKSRYIAYGSSFVIYYILVILQQRYFSDQFMMNPMEWFQFQHTWVFGQWGIILMLSGIIGILVLLYAQLARTWLDRI